jgi:pyruvate/2-oxoglutarate/acetoin dehydrogenase E1 component
MQEVTYIRAINAALREELARDPNVVILGLDVSEGAFTATKGLLKEFGPNRVRDYPISESSLVGLGAGAAVTGLRPVVEIMFMNFMACCMDSVINGVAKLKSAYGDQYRHVPLTIRTLVDKGGGQYHSDSYEALFAHIPGIKVVMPGTVYDVKGLLKSAIRDDNPVLFIEHAGMLRMKERIPEEEYLVPLGKANVKREGSDLTIVTWGRMVNEILAVAEELAQDGINAEVVDLRTLSPLDKETVLNSVQKTRKALVVHDATKQGGFGGEIAAIIADEAFDYLDAPIKRVAAKFAPLSFCPPLERFVLPTQEDVMAAVRAIT